MQSRLTAFALIVALAGCQDRPPEPAKPAAPTVYDREEFRKMVTGLTPDELIRAVGRPDSTTDLGTSQTWVYNGRTRDPVTGKVDLFAYLTIRGGKVAEVFF